jgi:4-amino-4-deoxy-L-arabinose transferase-like glycosyltransferase
VVPATSEWRARGLWCVVAVAVVIRLTWVAVEHRAPGGLSDPLLYQRFAQGIAAGQGYVGLKGHLTSYYPPGYPFFLGGIQWVAERLGHPAQLPLLAGVVQSLLGGVTAGGVWMVGRRLGGDRVALVGGLAFALWPNLVVYSSTLLSEPLFLACFAVMFVGLVTMIDDGRIVWTRGAAAALGTGAAAMVRPQVLLVVPAVAIAWVICRVPWRVVLGSVACTVVGLAVFVTPWAIRNEGVFGKFVPISTNGGDNLCVGFHPGADGGFQIPKYCDTGEFYVQGGPKAEVRRDATTRRRAIRWATHHLGALPLLSAKKLYYTYRDDIDGLRAYESYDQVRVFRPTARTALRATANIYYAVVMVLALVGLVMTTIMGLRSRREDATALVVVFTTLATALVPIIVFGDGRFKVPATPCFAVLAGVAVVSLWNRLRHA